MFFLLAADTENEIGGIIVVILGAVLKQVASVKEVDAKPQAQPEGKPAKLPPPPVSMPKADDVYRL